MSLHDVTKKAEQEARHTMGIIVWVVIVFVLVCCGIVGYVLVSIPWGVQ